VKIERPKATVLADLLETRETGGEERNKGKGKDRGKL